MSQLTSPPPTPTPFPDQLPHLSTYGSNELRKALRCRQLSTTGRKAVLVDRLYRAMREDYNKGWSFGEHLDTRIVPFAGKGFDPRRLVGCRVVYYRQVGPGYENGPFGSANVEIVGEGFSGCILVKAFSTDGWLDTMLEIDSGCIEFPHLTGIDSEARPIFSEPKKVIEAASGLRRNLCGQIISRVVGLRLEGMHHMSFLSGLKSKWTPNWVVGNFDVCLVDTQSLLTPIQSEGEKAEHKVAVIEYCPQDEDSSSEPTSAS